MRRNLILANTLIQVADLSILFFAIEFPLPTQKEKILAHWYPLVKSDDA